MKKELTTPVNNDLLSAEDLVMMSSDDVQEYMEKQRQKYLSMHKAELKQGEGSDKRWYTYLPIPSGKRKTKLIRYVKKEKLENVVIQFYMERETLNKKARISTAVIFSALFLLWIDYASKRPNIASETLRKYRNDYNRLVADSDFGKMKVREIDYIDIEDFLITQIQRFNLKKKALNNLHGYLRSVFAYAMRMRIIQSNPCDLVDLKNVRPYCDTTEKPNAERVLSDEELIALLNALHQHQAEYPLYMADYAIEICIHTGLRVGEVAALRWDCIADGELRNCQSEHRVNHENSASTYEIGATKNGKERRIAISDDLQEVFDRIRTLHEAHGIHSDYIIADANGRVIAPTISNAMYRRGDEADIKAKSIHALRRTLSSKLNVYYPPATVALTMGHTEEVNKRHYNYNVTSLHERKAVMDRISAGLHD